MMNELARLHVRDLSGVFAARRLGRELAARLGLDRQDQVRVATALSEISRSVITGGHSAVIAFGADEDYLVLTVTADGPPPADGITAAARLMDTVESDGPVVRHDETASAQCPARSTCRRRAAGGHAPGVHPGRTAP